MKVAFIAPNEAIPKLVPTGYYLALPWNIRLYEDQPGYIILDNGAAEGHELDWDNYIDLAIMHGVNELVIPDVLREYHKSRMHCQVFIEEYYSQLDKPVHLMGVVQGDNLNEFRLAALDYAALSEVQTLGVPKHMTRTLKNSWARIEFIQWLMDEGIEDTFDNGIHCLGATDWVREVRVLSELPIVRGIDTSVPAIAALEGKNIEDLHLRHERRPNFFEHELSLTDIGYLTHNQTVYMRWADGTI